VDLDVGPAELDHVEPPCCRCFPGRVASCCRCAPTAILPRVPRAQPPFVNDRPEMRC
jgi:hypothetical protein